MRAGFVIILCALSGVQPRKLPSWIHRCRNDDQLGPCIAKVFEDNRERFLRGVPEMQLPPLDPMVVERVELQAGNGTALALHAVFTNIHVVGAGQAKLHNIKPRLNADEPDVYLETFFPSLAISADYHLKGKILILNLDGVGKAYSNYTNISGSNYYKAKRIMKNKKQYLKWTDKNTTLSIGHASFHFDDLFRGNPALTETTNRVINENSRDIIQEFQPLVEDTISAVTFSLLDRVYTLYSLEELFEDYQ